MTFHWLDPRMKLLTASTTDESGFKRARSIAALKAAAEAYGWDKRPSPKPLGTGAILTGRGIAYAFRGQTIAAEIAEVEVNRQTGHVWAKRLVCAHDCGLVVNPEALRHTVECAMLHSLSRALHEEVQFDTEKVTSVDWNSHPTLTHADAPARRSNVVLVNGDLIRSDRISLLMEVARQHVSPCSRRLPTQSTMRLAFGSVEFHSEMRACSPHSKPRAFKLLPPDSWRACLQLIRQKLGAA